MKSLKGGGRCEKKGGEGKNVGGVWSNEDEIERKGEKQV